MARASQPAGRPVSQEALRAFARLRALRQAAVWAPIVWFPVALSLLAVGAFGPACAMLLSGVSFALILRAAVRFAHCPNCGHPFRSSAEDFREIWNEARCLDCGLSLFELRRGHARERARRN